MVEVGSVIVARLRRDAKVAAEKCRPDLGDQFFAGVTSSPNFFRPKSRSRRAGCFVQWVISWASVEL